MEQLRTRTRAKAFARSCIHGSSKILCLAIIEIFHAMAFDLVLATGIWASRVEGRQPEDATHESSVAPDALYLEYHNFTFHRI